MLGFNLFRTERRFSSYDECPEIYYRFNGRGEYGPQKLDRIVEFFAKRSDEPIEGRFADEKQWRPLAYFLNLWETIPSSARTFARLKKQGIEVQALSESAGRELLRDRQNLNPATIRQLEQLRELGLAVETGLNRGKAEELIRERHKVLDDEKKRLQEAPEIESCKSRLQQLKPKVHEILPDWNPPEFNDDLGSLSSYVDIVQESLEHAKFFDLAALQSDLFYDYMTENDYYLEFSRDPTDAEMRAFQGQIFLNYLRVGGEDFDHLRVLKHALPMVRVERV